MRPILMAAWHGHTDAVQMLINYGASVNTINKVSLNNLLTKILSTFDVFFRLSRIEKCAF
jgi:ankyrin repeat protein